MRPTPDKERLKIDLENGTSLVLDPSLENRVLSEDELDAWVLFAEAAVKGFASNADLTANNPPTTLSDEACLLADRMLLAFLHRKEKCKNSSSSSNIPFINNLVKQNSSASTVSSNTNTNTTTTTRKKK